MSPWKALLVATAALATLLAADATVETTCKAAAAIDVRIDYGFCVSELSKHRDSPGADTWGLAKVAANLGVNNAGGAVREADALLARPPGTGADDAKARAALGRRCDAVFAEAGIPSLLTRRGEYAEQITVLCIAITDLIK